MTALTELATEFPGLVDGVTDVGGADLVDKVTELCSVAGLKDAQCSECGSYTEACAFCPKSARHLIILHPGEAGGKDIVVCDKHVDLFLNENDEPRDGFETGAYHAGPDNCACDTWK